MVMNLPEISVIIPTFNRWETLLQSLLALKKQTFDASTYEIIVVNDGSTDNAYAGMGRCDEIGIPNLKHLNQKKNGPGSARNLGIRHAKGRILLFLGDDIIVSENLLEEHFLFHSEKFKGKNFACLGYVTWPLSFCPTPFLQFLESWGQFLFENISDGEELDYNYFYSSNISLKKNFLDEKDLLFDEDFKEAAWEDIEFGYRGEKEGLKIIFNRNAVGFHNHCQTLESAINRMGTSGRSLFVLLKKWPELAKKFGFLKTERGYIARHKLIKGILRNKLSIVAIMEVLKLLDKTIIPEQDINENRQDRSIPQTDRRGFLTPQKESNPLSPPLIKRGQEGIITAIKRPNKLLKVIYKNILLYYLQRGFEEAQQNWQT